MKIRVEDTPKEPEHRRPCTITLTLTGAEREDLMLRIGKVEVGSTPTVSGLYNALKYGYPYPQ